MAFNERRPYLRETRSGGKKGPMSRRITEHPILKIEPREDVTFFWNGRPLQAKKGEVLSSALIANGVTVFSTHAYDGSAQGIFCANGQCSKCLVIADGVPVKSCMIPVREGMRVRMVDGLPELPAVSEKPRLGPVEEVTVQVLSIGGGPAGLSAAIELGRAGVKTLVVDDKSELGGKLVLQTHKFFGSIEDSQAGTRGNIIGRKLAAEVESNPHITVWVNSTVLFVYKDRKVGVLRNDAYTLVKPDAILNAAGARERLLRFHNNTLVGVYGAGAFQTLANRDLVRPSKRLFVIGGGNVGLIASYHALQAGIDVVGLAEVMPQCGGYKVHADKLQRLGVPIYTSHSILSANGAEHVESITIARVDGSFRFIPGTEKTFACDTILIAVGLDPIDEFTREAESAGIPVVAAGDAGEIAEASSAMFNGRIAGLKLAGRLGAGVPDIPESWYKKAEILKSHPGKIEPQQVLEEEEGVMPVIHCIQEIPCNPCITVCPTNSIVIRGDPIMGNPVYEGTCSGCHKCVLICPGLAITLVDFRKDKENPLVTVPYEVFNYRVNKDQEVTAVDIEGRPLGNYRIVSVVENKSGRTQLIRIKLPKALAKKVVSFRIQADWVSKSEDVTVKPGEGEDDVLACFCERVKASEIRALVRQGITDLNQIKALTRAGMGSCGAKSCDALIRQIMREEGVPAGRIVANTKRPVFVEVPIGILAGAGTDDSGAKP